MLYVTNFDIIAVISCHNCISVFFFFLTTHNLSNVSDVSPQTYVILMNSVNFRYQFYLTIYQFILQFITHSKKKKKNNIIPYTTCASCFERLYREVGVLWQAVSHESWMRLKGGESGGRGSRVRVTGYDSEHLPTQPITQQGGSLVQQYINPSVRDKPFYFLQLHWWQGRLKD